MKRPVKQPVFLEILLPHIVFVVVMDVAVLLLVHS